MRRLDRRSSNRKSKLTCAFGRSNHLQDNDLRQRRGGTCKICMYDGFGEKVPKTGQQLSRALKSASHVAKTACRLAFPQTRSAHKPEAQTRAAHKPEAQTRAAHK